MTAGGSGVASLRGVSLRYGETRAVDDVSLEIPANRMVGLIGPDGVGKSSLLALLAGARKMQDGEIRVLDGDMRDRRHRRAVCPRIAYMPQGLGKNLYPTLSVFENVDFFGRLFGHDKAERERRIADLLQSTGLAPFAERPAGKLSGGMKQKLGLCCALIHDPDLLILDEPTTGVDPLSRNQFWELIGRIRAGREGRACWSPPPTWRKPSASTGWWRWTTERSWPPVRRRSCASVPGRRASSRRSSPCCRKASAPATIDW